MEHTEVEVLLCGEMRHAGHERLLERPIIGPFGEGSVPGRADGYPSGPPTDPYVRDSRIRFLKQSLCDPPQSTGVLVSGLVSSMSLPWFPPVGHSTRRRLPSRGSLGPRFPTFPGTMRRYDCHPAPLGSLRLSLASRYLGLLPCVRGVPDGLMSGWKPPSMPGPLVARSPHPGVWARRERALPRSRVPPVKACPARRVEIRRAQP